MIEPTKSPHSKTKLPFHWIEEEEFEVTLNQGSTADTKACSDTAFLIKHKALPRPVQFPTQ